MSFRGPQDCHNPTEIRILSDIRTTGWSLMAVLDYPPFAYTVGLEHSFEHPEMIITGMPPTLACNILIEISKQIRRGRYFRAGAILRGEEIRCSTNLLMGEVSARSRRDYMLCSQWLYASEDYRALQVIWPDTRGCFPHEPDFERRFRAHQPLLSLAPRYTD